MQVSKWMTKNPRVVSPETPIVEAYRVFEECEIRHIPVVVGSRLVGIISDHDLSQPMLNKMNGHVEGELGPVSGVMTRNVITIGTDREIPDAAFLMHNHKIGALPVVDDEGNLVGILSVNDLLEILIAQLSEVQ